jgi:fructokinase
LYHRDSWFYNSGFKIRVKDTVGAGDSFLAALVNGLIKAIPLQLALDNACAMGALVAGSDGANPIITEKDLRRFIRKD